MKEGTDISRIIFIGEKGIETKENICFDMMTLIIIIIIKYLAWRSVLVTVFYTRFIRHMTWVQIVCHSLGIWHEYRWYVIILDIQVSLHERLTQYRTLEIHLLIRRLIWWNSLTVFTRIWIHDYLSSPRG